MKNHFCFLAAYNLRMNRQIFNTALDLSQTDLEKNMGAFFGSILATLNHIMVGDLLWLARMSNHSDKYNSLSRLSDFKQPTALNDVLYSNIFELNEKRVNLDKIIVEWAEEHEESDYNKYFTYPTMKGNEDTKIFNEVLSHFFNHQTHHRGQISVLLSQLGKDIGVTDFIIDIPSKQA